MEKSVESIIVGIAGGSCAGKSLVCKQIVNQLKKLMPNIPVTVISIDNYYKSLSNVNINTYNFDVPDALDLDQLTLDLTQLKQNKTIYVPQYDYKTHKRTSYYQCIPTSEQKRLILIEGLHVLNKKLRDLLNVKIFVDATDNVRLNRRKKRDIAERDRTIDSIVDRYIRYVKPAYKKYIKPTQQFADITIVNNQTNELNINGVDIICAYLKIKYFS